MIFCEYKFNFLGLRMSSTMLWTRLKVFVCRWAQRRYCNTHTKVCFIRPAKFAMPIGAYTTARTLARRIRLSPITRAWKTTPSMNTNVTIWTTSFSGIKNPICGKYSFIIKGAADSTVQLQFLEPTLIDVLFDGIAKHQFVDCYVSCLTDCIIKI
jgi:hypothetical protein